MPSIESLLVERVGRDGGGADESKRESADEFEYLRDEDETLFERTLGSTVQRCFWIVFIDGDGDNKLILLFFTSRTHPCSHVSQCSDKQGKPAETALTDGTAVRSRRVGEWILV